MLKDGIENTPSSILAGFLTQTLTRQLPLGTTVGFPVTLPLQVDPWLVVEASTVLGVAAGLTSPREQRW